MNWGALYIIVEQTQKIMIMKNKINAFTYSLFLFINLTIGLLFCSQSNLNAQLQAGSLPVNANLDTTNFNHEVNYTSPASYYAQLNLDEDMSPEIQFHLSAYYGTLSGIAYYFQVSFLDPTISVGYSDWGFAYYANMIDNGNTIDNSLTYNSNSIYIASEMQMASGGEATYTDSFRYLPFRQFMGNNSYRYGWIRFSIKNTTMGYHIQGFSWTHFSPGNPLPIQQLTLSTNHVSSSKINLSWTGTEEFQGESFSIERSTDGVNFSTLKSYLPSNNITKYEDQIVNVNSNKLFYRIAARDMDGKNYYSNVCSVQLSKNEGIRVYPTVCSNGFYLDLLEIDHGYTLCLVDCNGRTIQQTQFYSNNPLFYFDMEKLQEGFYFLYIHDGTSKYSNSFKIIKRN